MTYKLISLVLLSIMIFTACEKKEEIIDAKPSVKVVKIFDLKHEKKNSNDFSYPAEILAFQDVSMAFEVNGKIVKFYYKEGEKVKKGSVVAKLDDTIYKANYNARKANYNQAKDDYRRYENLYKSKSVSKSDFEKKRQNLQVTKANMQIAKKNLEETRLVAEFDGIIAKKMVDDYARVTAKQPIVRLQDNSSYKIKFFVPENDVRLFEGELSIKSISKMLDFFVTFENDKNKQYNAKIIDISTTAEKVTRTFESTLQMQNQENVTILPGMTAQVRVVVKNSKKNRAFIPFRAVFSDNTKKSYIWIVNEKNRVIKKEVRLGKLTEEFVEIIGGLDDISKVITSGVHFLEPNDEVKEYEKIGN